MKLTLSSLISELNSGTRFFKNIYLCSILTKSFIKGSFHISPAVLYLHNTCVLQEKWKRWVVLLLKIFPFYVASVMHIELIK